MTSDRLADSARPMGGVGKKHVLRVYRHGERVETARGMWPAARLRPGDRLVLPGAGAGLTVEWLAMSRSGPGGEIQIRVMFGHQEAPRTVPRALPLGGWISRETGRLMRALGRAGAVQDPAQ